MELLQSIQHLLRCRELLAEGFLGFQLPFSVKESPLVRPLCLVQWVPPLNSHIRTFYKQKASGECADSTSGSLALQSQGCASPMTTGTAWPAAPLMVASHCASWCLLRPPCSVCCGATPAVSPISPGPSPMTSLCPPHSMLPCASGPLRTAAASGRSLTLMALNCSAAPSSQSTTTSLWSGSRVPTHGGGGDAGPGGLF